MVTKGTQQYETESDVLANTHDVWMSVFYAITDLTRFFIRTFVQVYAYVLPVPMYFVIFHISTVFCVPVNVSQKKTQKNQENKPEGQLKNDKTACYD